MKALTLVRYGEIALKGKNQKKFLNRLIKNIRKALGDIEGVKVRNRHGRIFVDHEDYDKDEVISRLTKVFGIVSVSPAEVCENDIDEMFNLALQQMQELVKTESIKTFKVETRRSNKGFHLKSPEISKRVGGYINSNIDSIAVDVHNPDVIINIEVRNQTYIYSKKIQACGGLPYGTASKAMLMLSGGIDSPVAGWMMAKRGVEIEAVHYHSYPFTSERAQEKVYDLAKKLAESFGSIKVHSVNILNIQKAINENCPSEEMTIISRKFMTRIANKLAADNACKAIITGENIAQVASQTMEGLNVTNEVSVLPIFRPLIALDKVDIISIAKSIDTYETSILPFEDCCTVFLPDRVVTKPRIDRIKKSEEALNIDQLVQEAIDNKEVKTFTRDE